MKINWGAGVLIAFGIFMSFILYFVFKVQGNPEYENELVVEEYYKHDAHFGNEMKKIQDAADLPYKPTISNTDSGIEIAFPEYYSALEVAGRVSLYRPSAKKLDFEVPLKLSRLHMLIPESDLAGGNWDITLSWNCEGKDFIMKKALYIK